MSKFNVGDRVLFTPVEYGIVGDAVRATIVRVGEYAGFEQYDYLVKVDDEDTPDHIRELMEATGKEFEAAYERELEPID